MDLTALLPLLVILLLIPMFLSGRRQRRQMQEMQQLQSSLSDGDVVMTTSGLRATVVDSSYEDTIDLEIAPGVVTTWVRQAVREKVNPPVADTDGNPTDAAKPADAVEASTDGAKPKDAVEAATDTPANDPTTGRASS
jgi:preprotein translocase subunit YajC